MCQPKTECCRLSGNKTKTIPTSWGVHGIIWLLGVGYFHWMAATSLKILARATEKSLLEHIQTKSCFLLVHLVT